MLLFLLVAPLLAQSAFDIENGRLVYRANCAICHGTEGKGGRGPDLTTGVFRRGSAYEDLFKSIRNGIPGTEMPPIMIEGQQMMRLIAYVRSLNTGRAAVTLDGDVAQGKQIVERKGGCLKCHQVNGRGSRLGPDLSSIGSEIPPVLIEEALKQPSNRMIPRNWMIKAVTRDSGETILGRRLNEDTLTVQIIDSKERLLSLHKDELKSFEVMTTSPMPSYDGKLTAEELKHVVTYLASLRR